MGRFSLPVITLLYCLFSTAPATAQTALGNWFALSIDRPIGDKVELSLSPELRTDNALGTFDRLFLEVGVSYELAKRFNVSSEYRFSYFNNERGLENRFNLGLKYGYRKKPFTYYIASKFQWDITYRNDLDMAWRTKPEIRYRINKRWSPYVFGEIQYRVSYLPNDFERYRLGGGMRFSRKDHAFRLYYIWQQQINTFDPGSRHILAVKYGWDWD